MLLARRNLLRDKVRLALSVLGVALSVMLILLLSGYMSGIYRQASALLRNMPGQLVVSQAGVRNFVGTSSLLPPGTVDVVRATPGVARAVPLLMQPVVLELHGRKEIASIVGYDRQLGGGPWKLAEGREPRVDGEVVFDRVLADQHGIRPGDALRVLDRTVTVVGLSDETSLWIGSVVFAPASTVQSLLRAPGAWSFVLVEPAPGVAAETLRARLALPGIEAFLKGEKIESDRKLLARIYDAPLGLMVAIAFFVGVLVVGLIIYTATIERRREYGAVKAIGARNRTLYRVVATQALIAAVSGGALGIGLALGFGRLLVVWRPQFPVVIEPAAVAGVVAAGLLMALLAALIPARAIARLEPAEVFRG